MKDKLEKLGFSDTEAKIYIALLEIGGSSANEIAKRTYTNRTFTYNILEQLVDKGIVVYIIKDKKRLYSIANPESLLTTLKEKEKIAGDVIKEIKKFKPKAKSTRTVEVFEGLEGAKTVFNEIRISKELCVLNATGLIFETLEFSAEHIVKDIQRKGKPKIIATQSMKKTPMINYKNMKVKFLPKSHDNYATTFIYNGNIAIMNLKDKPLIIKIGNKEIYEGYKKDFELLWRSLE